MTSTIFGTSADDLQMRAVYDYYLTEREPGTNILHLWEEGRPWGNSTTPSICSDGYRAHIIDVVQGLCDATPRGSQAAVLSVGCGNAIVERLLVDAGRDVTAVDVVPTAIELARAKGVRAIEADILRWEPGERWDVVYADGVLGHVCRDGGPGAALQRLAMWLRPGGRICVSNDTCDDERRTDGATGVPGFYWLSQRLLRDELLWAGFDDVASETFIYDRPLSGPRSRAIVTATLAAASVPAS